MLASCGKVDLGKLETGKPYVGQLHNDDIVVVFDQVTDGNVKGHYYIDTEALIVDPVVFSSQVKRNGRGSLKHGDEEGKIKISVGDGSLQGKCGSSDFVLRPYVEDTASFHSFYLEPMYKVFEEQDRVYAHDVSGYWSSYPETREKFSAIYLRKISELAFSRDLDLDMDLYYPKTPATISRPLLVLIHGGAFYNGDKRSVGFPEMGYYFAKRGYVVASINYRLGYRPSGKSIDRAGYRAVQDAHAAVRYLISCADEFQIDTDNIFIAGTSAGAITALNLAFMREETRPEASHKVTWGPDLGPIGSVNPDMDIPFKIKAVVDMWGAVHDLSMLASSKQTAVLSFHGDQDPIVPYGFGYPFHDMLDSHVEDVFRPMYGSAAITEKMDAMGMRCELHTSYGGGHSLHVDEDENLTAYFKETILPNMTRFLCEELVGGVMVKLIQNETDERWFEADGVDNVAELHWQVDGGVVVGRHGDNQVKVMLFADAPKHSVTVGGKYENGVEYCDTWDQ